jgi:predicted DNA-binding protein with PD1-like motif
MDLLPLRLLPGDDLRKALEAAVASRDCGAAFVLSGIGSLGNTKLRLAGATTPAELTGPLEILSLAGSISVDGSHLHMSIADSTGRVLGGHVAYGCVVRTTAEVLLVLIREWSFTRETDAVTGYKELVARTKSGADASR